MRERSTWNRDQIVRTATTGKRAEDPRAMNQDHLKQQPAADAYVTGGPSEFGEDVHPSAGTWKAEYKGDEVARNEIGMPEIRKDTFNHSEKTAMDDGYILRKADFCTKVARTMLKNASEEQIEEQALALMHMPDAALIDTNNRLATAIAEDEEGKDQDQDKDQDQGKQAKDAQQDEKKQGQGQQQDDKKSKAMAQEQEEKKQGKDAGQVPPQFLENIKKKKDEAKDDDKGDDKKDQGKNKQGSAGAQFVAAIKSGNGEGVESALQAMIAQAFQQMGQGQNGQQQQQAQQQGQNQQQMAQSEQQGASAIQGQGQNQQQPMAQGQNQQPMAQGQNGQQQQQQAQGMPQTQMSDDQLLDQMLQDEMGQGQMGQPQMMMAANGPEIQLEANTMDVGEVSLEAGDDVLNTLFASNNEYQNAAEAHALQNGGARPNVNASQPMTRTAATRTVGTRPTAGVSQIGGGVAGSTGVSDVDKLSGLWASAPDVSGVFR